MFHAMNRALSAVQSSTKFHIVDQLWGKLRVKFGDDSIQRR